MYKMVTAERKTKAYFFTGLGADKRIFQKIKLPENYEIIFVEWIEPFQKESFRAYCIRLLKNINTSEPFVFVGLSFGGMVATELCKLCNPQKLILISSISTSAELPNRYRFFYFMGLYSIMPVFLIKSVNIFTYWFVGAKSKESRYLLKQILKDTSSVFLKWALTQNVKWKNTERPKMIIHIHGTDDKLLNHNKTRAEIKIIGGGHLMVFDKADEIILELAKILN